MVKQIWSWVPYCSFNRAPDNPCLVHHVYSHHVVLWPDPGTDSIIQPEEKICHWEMDSSKWSIFWSKGGRTAAVRLVQSPARDISVGKPPDKSPGSGFGSSLQVHHHFSQPFIPAYGFVMVQVSLSASTSTGWFIIIIIHFKKFLYNVISNQ